MKNFLANIISGIFHPLLMPTFGCILAVNYTYLLLMPAGMKLWVVGTVFVLTAVMPAVFIGVMIKLGMAGDAELTNRRERSLPYLILITALLMAAFVLNRMLMPPWVVAQMIGAACALFGALLINFYWKISAHLMGIGGLTGGVMGVAWLMMRNPYWGFIALCLIAGAVGTSRLILKRHTPMQVYAGFALGFACIFASSLLSHIYLFI